jgi:hypothetical protein
MAERIDRGDGSFKVLIKEKKSKNLLGMMVWLKLTEPVKVNATAWPG